MATTPIIYTTKETKECTKKYPGFFDDIDSAQQVYAYINVIPKKKTEYARIFAENMFKEQTFEVYRDGVKTGELKKVYLIEFLSNPKNFCDQKKTFFLKNVKTGEEITYSAAMCLGYYACKCWGLLDDMKEIDSRIMLEYAEMLRTINPKRFGNSVFEQYQESKNSDLNDVAARIVIQRNALYGETNARGNNNIFHECIATSCDEVLGECDRYERTAYIVAVSKLGIQTADEYRTKKPRSIPKTQIVNQPVKKDKTEVSTVETTADGNKTKQKYEKVSHKIVAKKFVEIWRRAHIKMNEYVRENYPHYKVGRGVETLKITIGERDETKYYDQKVSFGNMPQEFIGGTSRKNRTNAVPYMWILTRSRNGYLVELNEHNCSNKPTVDFVASNLNYKDWMSTYTRQRTGIYIHIPVNIVTKRPNYTKSYKKHLLNNDTTDGVDVNQEIALMNTTLGMSFAAECYVDWVEALHAFHEAEPDDPLFENDTVKHVLSLYHTKAHNPMMGMFAGTKENIVVNDDLTCSIKKDIMANCFYWLKNRKKSDSSPYYTNLQIKYIKDVQHMRNNVRTEIKNRYDRNMIQSLWVLSHKSPCSKETCDEYRLSLEESDKLATRQRALVSNVSANSFASMYSNPDAPSVIGMERANFCECKKTKYERGFKRDILEHLGDVVNKMSLTPVYKYAGNAMSCKLEKQVNASYIKKAMKNSEFWKVVSVKVDGNDCVITALPTARNLTVRLRGEYGQVMKTMSGMCQMKDIVAAKVAKFDKPVFVRLLNPKNTSITCPSCGYVDKENRNGRKFECKHCGYKDDSDHVGCLNLQGRTQKVNVDENADTEDENEE